MTNKIILFLLSFYGASLLGCEESSALPSNYADRVRNIMKQHKWKIPFPSIKVSQQSSGKQVKQISIKIEELTEIESELQELEQYDWKNAKRENATETMKRGIRFAHTLNLINDLFSIERQYREDNWLVTIFEPNCKPDSNLVESAFSPLLEKRMVDLEFLD